MLSILRGDKCAHYAGDFICFGLRTDCLSMFGQHTHLWKVLTHICVTVPPLARYHALALYHSLAPYYALARYHALACYHALARYHALAHYYPLADGAQHSTALQQARRAATSLADTSQLTGSRPTREGGGRE
jgi:hypothetical protein